VPDDSGRRGYVDHLDSLANARRKFLKGSDDGRGDPILLCLIFRGVALLQIGQNQKLRVRKKARYGSLPRGRKRRIEVENTEGEPGKRRAGGPLSAEHRKSRQVTGLL
jgi:hypothetical protein